MAGSSHLLALALLALCCQHSHQQLQVIPDSPSGGPRQHERYPLEPDQGTMPLEAVDLTAAAQLGLGQQGEQHTGQPSAASMESLLHWAIEHSDPAVLRESAEQLHAINTLHEQRQRVKELMGIMDSQPSEADIMKEAIAILNRLDVPDEHLLQTLSALQVLVEPIDNANDLKTLGGIAPVVRLMSAANTTLQAAACYLLGTAASNNPTFQRHLVQEAPDVLATLTQLMSSPDPEVVVKALYAVAAMVRNLDSMRQAFYTAGGVEAVVHVLGRVGSSRTDAAPAPASSEGRVGTGREVRKALSLLVDLTRLDPTAMTDKCLQQRLPATITSLLGHPDADLQEKALDGLVTLVGTGSHALQEAFAHAGAGHAVEHLHQLLESQVQAEDGIDLDDHYFKYLLELCQEARRALQGSAAAAPLAGSSSSEEMSKDEL